MPKLKSYTYDIPLYGRELRVFFGQKNWAAAHELHNLAITHDMDAVVYDVDGIHYVGFRDLSGLNGGIIAHECVHLTNAIHEYVGVEADSSNDEPFAYMLQHLFLLIEDALKRHKKKK